MKILRTATLLFLGSGSLLMAALPTPLETRQHLTPYNFQSQRGVPLSSTNNVPPGSDGRAPTQTQQLAEGLTANTPTANQFQHLTPFGGIPGLTFADWQTVTNSTVLKAGTTPFAVAVALEMKRPVALSNNVVVMVFRRVQIGAPFVSQAVSFLFGSVVPVPDTDEKGVLLKGVAKESYWLAEPYSATGHANEAYYWSANARQVFGIPAGSLAVTWRKSTPYTAETKPAYTNLNGLPSLPSFATSGASYFLL
ncbi:MAG: hypothetical protein HY674_12065 [Chloroflexi bacterium]|nr:hypothetical protein [Chloroflexota bacterium]